MHLYELLCIPLSRRVILLRGSKPSHYRHNCERNSPLTHGELLPYLQLPTIRTQLCQASTPILLCLHMYLS